MKSAAAPFDRATLELAFKRLGDALGICAFDEAIATVSRYYPDGRISPKTRFGLQEIFGTGDTKDR